MRLPLDKLTKEYFDQIVSMLIESSLHTLEVLGFDGKAPVRDVMSVLRKFPNLKQVDCRFVRIYRGTDEGPSQRMYIRDARNLDYTEAIIQEWHYSQTHRPVGTIHEWWGYWLRAKIFMDEMVRAYRRQNGNGVKVSSVYVSFMYPIKAFLSRDDAVAYANLTGPWAGSRRSLTIQDVRRIMNRKTRR